MNNNIDLDTLLLENFELALNVVAREDNNLQAKLYMHYAVLKAELFERWGRREDLEEAIEKGRYVVAETRKEHEELCGDAEQLWDHA